MEQAQTYKKPKAYSGQAVPEAQYKTPKPYKGKAVAEEKFQPNGVGAGGGSIGVPPSGNVAGLQAPHEGMYEGMTDEDKLALYEAYKKHPSTEHSWTGAMSYKGQAVPDWRSTPKKMLDTATGAAEGYIDYSVGAVKGAYNAVRNTAETVAAAGEATGNRIDQIENPAIRGVARAAGGLMAPNSLLPKGSAEAIHENVPVAQTEGLAEGVGELVGETGVGFLAGTKGLDKLAQLPTHIPSFFRAISRYTTGALGAATTSDPESAIVDITGRMGIDPKTGTYDEQYLKGKLNLFVTAWLAAKPAEIAVKAGPVIAKKAIWDWFIKPIKNWGNLDVKKQTAVKEVATHISNIHPDDAPEIAAKKLEDLSAILRKNKFVEEASDTPGVDNLKIERDSISAMEAGGVSPEQVAGGRSIRNAALGKGSYQIETKQADATRQLGKVFDQTEEVFGGADTTEVSRKAIVDSGRKEVGTFENTVKDVQGKIDNSGKQLSSDMQNDEVFGRVMRDSSDISIAPRQNPAEDALLNKSADVIDTFKAGIKERADAIQGKPVNQKTLGKLLEKNKDLIHPDVLRMIKESNGDSKKLYENALKPLNKQIDDLYNSNKSLDGKRLEGIRDFINENIERTKAGKEFRRYYKDEYGRDVKDGVLNDVEKALQEGSRYGDEMNPRSIDKARNAITAVFGNKNRATAQHLVDVLERRTGDASEVTDYYVGKVANNINDEIASGTKLTDIKFSSYISQLRDGAEILPQAERAKVEGFIQKIIKSQNDLTGMQDELKGAEKLFKDAEDRIYNRELGKFFDTSEENPNAYGIFKSYMDNDNAGGQIDKLIKRIDDSNDPMAKDGLKSFFAKYMRDRFFAKTGTAISKDRKINEGEVRKIIDGTTQVMEYAKKIYGKDSAIVRMFDVGLRESHAGAAASSGRVVPSGAVDKADKDTRGAFDFLVTQVWGHLDKFGSRIRAAGGRVIASESSQQQTRDAWTAILKNPEELADGLEKYAKEIKGGMSPRDKRTIWQFMVTMGLFSNEDQEAKDAWLKSDADKQTDEAFK